MRIPRAAAALALLCGDAGFHLTDLPVAGHVVVAGNRDAPALQHQSSPAVQQVGRDTVTARHDRDTLATIERLLDDPQLLRRAPVTATTAVGDDLGHGHKPMLRG